METLRDILMKEGTGYTRNKKIVRTENTATEEIPMEYKKGLWEAKKKMLSQLIDINKKKNQLDNKTDK